MSDQTSPSPLLAQIGTALPLFAAALLVASVAYDYAFLFALNLTLDDIPSGLNEHVRSAVVWAPKVAIAIAIYAVVELFLRRMEGGLTEAELIARSPKPKFTRAFRRSGDAAMYSFAVLAAVLGPLVATDNGWVFFSFMVLWAGLAFSVLAHQQLRKNFESWPKRLLLILPVLLAMVCLQGHGAGKSLTTPNTPAWEATVKLGDETKVYPLLGLRRFTNFTIAVTAERQVWLLPNEAILAVRAVKPLDVATLNVCRWWGLLCAPAQKK